MSRKGKLHFLVMLLECLSKDLYDESQMINSPYAFSVLCIYIGEIKTENRGTMCLTNVFFMFFRFK